MAARKRRPPREVAGPLRSLTVGGFKSLRDDVGIDLGQLTVLAGANSSGKSSVMQPLLLLKQTVDAAYDPGPLLLNGPNVELTSADPMFFAENRRRVTTWHVAFDFGGGHFGDTSADLSFRRAPGGGVALGPMVHELAGRRAVLEEGKAPPADIDELMPIPWVVSKADASSRVVARRRCFLGVALQEEESVLWAGSTWLGEVIAEAVSKLIHVPGLRGNPRRSYVLGGAGDAYPGMFHQYVASVLAKWQRERAEEELRAVFDDLARLGLTWKVAVDRLSDTEVEIKVGRLREARRGGARDLVNIADVGFGVSQVLPVVVALHAAKPWQLVHIEQPEIHLHPRAQVAMAGVLARAAQRGVRVVVETHSSLLLLALQTLVAKGEVPPDLVRLHWFDRDDEGVTRVTSASLDEAGAFGDWPEDFGDVSLEAQDAYLTAASRRVLGK